MQLVSLLSGALYRPLPHETCTFGEWIANHSGSSASVLRYADGYGLFRAFVSVQLIPS